MVWLIRFEPGLNAMRDFLMENFQHLYSSCNCHRFVSMDFCVVDDVAM